MKNLFAALSALVLLASAAFAGGTVTYDLATVSIVIRQGSGTNITTTVLNNRKFLDFVATANNIPRSDLFIGISEATGELLVIQRSTETIRFGIVTNLNGPAGSAVNGQGSLRYLTFGCVISSLTTNFNGFFYETQKRNGNNVITSISRQFSGGNGTQVIKGSCKTTGRKITL